MRVHIHTHIHIEYISYLNPSELKSKSQTGSIWVTVTLETIVPVDRHNNSSWCKLSFQETNAQIRYKITSGVMNLACALQKLP